MTPPRWLLPVAAVVVIGGVGTALYRVVTSTEAVPLHKSSLEQVRAMLRDRSLRLTQGDVEGFLQPDTPAARGLEDPLARGTRQVPLVEVRMTVEPLRTMDLEGSSFKDLPTTFTYYYKDLPADNRFEFRYLTTIERQDTSWRVTGARLKPQQPERFDPTLVPPVWATGPIQVDRSGHLLALFRPGLPHERESMALAEQARSQLAPKVLLEFDTTHLVMLAANRPQYKEMVGDPRLESTSDGVAEFIFFADPVSGQQIPASRRMVVDTSAIFGPSGLLHGVDRTPTQILQHELGHLSMFRYMTPDTPTWINEGAAMYLADERRLAGWRQLVATDFSGESIEGIEDEWERRRDDPLPGRHYPYANAAVLAMVEHGGPQRWFDAFKGYKYVADYAGGVQQAKEKPTDIILQRFYTIDRAGLDALTRDYIRRAVAAAGG